jgi:hypothetical protein
LASWGVGNFKKLNQDMFSNVDMPDETVGFPNATGRRLPITGLVEIASHLRYPPAQYPRRRICVVRTMYIVVEREVLVNFPKVQVRSAR